MIPTLRAGVLLGVALALLEALLVGAGWIADPTLESLSWLAAPMIVAATVFALRQTAAAGRDTPGQIVAGAEVGIVAGVIAMGLTLAIHAYVFPGALVDARAAVAQQLAASGADAVEIDDALALMTPFGRGIVGFLQAMVLGIVTGAIAGRWLRASGERPRVAPDP